MIRNRRLDAVRPRATGAGDFAKDIVAIRDTPETDGDDGAPEGTVILESAALQRRSGSARKGVASPCRKHHTLAVASTSRAAARPRAMAVASLTPWQTPPHPLLPPRSCRHRSGISRSRPGRAPW